MGLSVITCYNLFLQFLYYKRGNKLLKTVFSMLSCGALGRSNNPYIESIVDRVFLRIRDLRCVGLILKEILKKTEAMKKLSMSRKQNLYTCVLGRKKNSFEISVIILRL